MNTGTTRVRQPPLWLRGGRRPTLDFFSDPRRRCIGQTELFYDEENIESLAICQSLCVRCPVFQDCTRWALSHDEPDGIYAGLTPHVRNKIAAGEPYYDWRREWHQRYHLPRIARRTLKTKLGKRTRKDAELPPCPYCGSPRVNRNGRSTTDKSLQRFRCNNCRFTFYREDGL